MFGWRGGSRQVALPKIGQGDLLDRKHLVALLELETIPLCPRDMNPAEDKLILVPRSPLVGVLELLELPLEQRSLARDEKVVHVESHSGDQSSTGVVEHVDTTVLSTLAPSHPGEIGLDSFVPPSRSVHQTVGGLSELENLPRFEVHVLSKLGRPLDKQVPLSFLRRTAQEGSTDVSAVHGPLVIRGVLHDQLSAHLGQRWRGRGNVPLEHVWVLEAENHQPGLGLASLGAVLALRWLPREDPTHPK